MTSSDYCKRCNAPHAPPRLHDRRGHIRRLASGKNVWVKACNVGDASLGAVFHDYKIEAK